MRITLDIETQRCKTCKRENDFVCTSTSTYGLLIGTYDNGNKYALLNIINNPCYNEFVALFNDIISEYDISDWSIDDKLSCIHNAFSVACDKINESRINFGTISKKCKYCGSKNFEKTLSKPIHFIDVNAVNITHSSWYNKSAPEKHIIIRKEIENYIKICTNNHFSESRVRIAMLKYGLRINLYGGSKKYPIYNSDGIPFMDGKSLFVDNKGNLTYTVYHAGVLIKQHKYSELEKILFYVFDDITKEMVKDCDNDTDPGFESRNQIKDAIDSLINSGIDLLTAQKTVQQELMQKLDILPKMNSYDDL